MNIFFFLFFILRLNFAGVKGQVACVLSRVQTVFFFFFVIHSKASHIARQSRVPNSSTFLLFLFFKSNLVLSFCFYVLSLQS